MRLARVTLAIAAVGLIGVPRTLWAQQSGQSGMFGSGGNSMGSGFSPGQGSLFGGSTGNSLGLGSQTSGMSGMSGMSGSGQNIYGQSSSNVGVGGQARQAGSFIGVTSSQQTGSGFIGAVQSGGTQGMNQLLGGNGYSSMSSLGSGGQLRQGAGTYGGTYGNGMGMNGAGQSGLVTIRTRLTLGFDRPKADGQQISSALAQRLTGLPALHWLSPCRIEVRGRTTILRGSVATEHDRDLVARVASLEATVDQVQNQIVVGSRATSPTKPAGALSPERPAALSSYHSRQVVAGARAAVLPAAP
jgi:hypothetical protein